MALNTKKPIEELKAIIEAMDYFNKVSVGKVPELTAEDVFPACYISFDTDINESNGKLTTSGGEYNRMVAVIVKVHLDLTDEEDLFYLDVRDMVEEAIMKDTTFWQVVIDRDFIGSRWDTGANLPQKEGEMALSLFVRADYC